LCDTFSDFDEKFQNFPMAPIAMTFIDSRISCCRRVNKSKLFPLFSKEPFEKEIKNLLNHADDRCLIVAGTLDHFIRMLEDTEVTCRFFLEFEGRLGTCWDKMMGLLGGLGEG
jgi:hypothetical protein